MFAVLLGAGLLTHQFMYVIMYKGYLRINFAPALGVRLPGWAFSAVQVAAIPAVVALLLLGHPVATGVALALYVLWASVQSMRISNHVWLGFLAIALLGFAEPSEQVTVARLLLGGLYLLSGLIKCNDEFLFSEQSAAKEILYLQEANGNWRAPKAVVALSPFLTAIAEIGVGVALLVDVNLVAAFVVAAVFHFSFGFVGNVHFSVIAMSIWWVALQAELPSWAVLADNGLLFLAAAVLGAGSSLLLKANLRDFIEYGSRAGTLGSALLNGLYPPIALLVWFSIPSGPTAPAVWSVEATVAVLAMLLNLVLLLMGRKSEWTYAMFSNVRPYSRARIFGYTPPWRARYYDVSTDGPISEAALALIPEHTREQLAAGTHLFSGPVVSELQRIGERTGQEFRITPVRFTSDGSLVADHDSEVDVATGPLWVAPSINREIRAVHFG